MIYPTPPALSCSALSPLSLCSCTSFFHIRSFVPLFLDRLVHLVSEKRENDKKTRASSNELEGRKERERRKRWMRNVYYSATKGKGMGGKAIEERENVCEC